MHFVISSNNDVTAVMKKSECEPMPVEPQPLVFDSKPPAFLTKPQCLSSQETVASKPRVPQFDSQEESASSDVESKPPSEQTIEVSSPGKRIVMKPSPSRISSQKRRENNTSPAQTNGHVPITEKLSGNSSVSHKALYPQFYDIFGTTGSAQGPSQSVNSSVNQSNAFAMPLSHKVAYYPSQTYAIVQEHDSGGDQDEMGSGSKIVQSSAFSRLEKQLR